MLKNLVESFETALVGVGLICSFGGLIALANSAIKWIGGLLL